MRNFKKISAVVVALSIMVTTFVPAFAATNTTVNGDKAVVLNTLDLYAGTSTSSFVPALETELTRGQGAVLLTKLFNMDDAALALTDAQANEILKGFADASQVPSYAKNRLAYLVQNKIMSGSLDTSTGKLYIDAGKSLLGGQFATLLLKQMGFTVASWKLSVEQLSNVDGAKDIASYLSFATNELIRDQAVGIMYGSLTAQYADGLATIIEKIVAAKPELKAAAVAAGLIVVTPATLDVTKVAALNLREVAITFNKAVDATQAKKVANYTIKGATTASPEAATLSDDGLTVTLRTSEANSLSNYSTDNELTILKAVGFDADKVIKGIAASDTTVPSLVSVKTTGPRNIKVTISEPIDETAAASVIANAFKVDAGLIGFESVTVSGREVSIKTYSDLAEGAHKIEVVSPSVLKDDAGYPLQVSSIAFDYVKDTSPLSFTVVESNETSVTINFNKALKTGTFGKNTSTGALGNANVEISHSYADLNKVLASAAATTTDDQKFVITFTSPFPPATTNVFVKYTSDSGTKIEDTYGNKLAATTFTVTTSADVTKPTATAEFVDAKTVKVTYSEDVLAGVGTNGSNNISNYVLKSGTDVVSITDASFATDSKKIVNLTTGTDALNGTTYTLAIKNVKDISVAANQIDEVTLTFTGTDKVAPAIKTAALVSTTKYKITFTEAMDVATITDKSVYKLNGNALADKDTVEAVDSNKAVVITFATAPTTGTAYTVQIGRVKDVAGNWIKEFLTEKTFTGAVVASIPLNEYQIVSKTGIKLIVEDSLQNVQYTDFQYTTGSGFVAAKGISQVSVVDGKTYITLVTDDLGLTTTSTGIEVKTVADVSSKNTYGSKLAFDTSITDLVLTDKCAPEKLKDSVMTFTQQDDANTTSMNKSLATVTITYSENIYAASVTDADYTVAGYTVDGVVVTGDKVIITVKNLDYGSYVLGTTEVAVKQVGEIQDASKNILVAQDEWKNK